MELYRKSALEKISSPEQLDKAMTVTSPLSWLALVAVTVMIVITIVWSIIGTIPVTVSTKGILASPVSTNALFMTESGKVDAVLVHPGSELVPGTPVLNYRTGNGDVKTITADQIGVVTEIFAQRDAEVTQGSEILRLSPLVTGDKVVVCYTDLRSAKKIRRGMEANVFLDNSQIYGHMRARVVNIDSYVSSTAGMSYVLGSDNSLASDFQINGSAVVAVTCELYPDSESVSGLYWSNAKGRKLTVTNGSLVDVKVVVEEVAPITKLFSKLKDLWEE